MSEDKGIIIIKKIKKGGHGGHHGGAWKVAYADFVTAMMALFIVLWILGQSEEVTKSISAYFQDPMAFDQAVAAGQLPQYLEQTQHLYAPTPVASETPEANNNGSNGNGKGDKEAMQKTADRIMADLKSIPEFEKIMDKVHIEVKDDFAIIELTEPNSEYFFDVGASAMKPEARKLLGIIAQELNKMPNKVIVAGHTDSRPFISGSHYYSNWELSADRANSARKVMEESGLNPKKVLEVRGCADKSPKYPSDPYNPLNRRITIMVLFKNYNNSKH